MKKFSDLWIVLIVLLSLNFVLTVIILIIIVSPQKFVDKKKDSVAEVEYSLSAKTDIDYGYESDDIYVHDETQEEEESDENALRPLVWKTGFPQLDSERSREENAELKTSYEETIERYEQAKEIVDNNSIDFSNVKITVLGDSLTEGVGLEGDEKEKYNWPKQLEEILRCKEVVNKGISGSTVENLKDHDPMCKRWEEIDDDNDVIIIMGGTNDVLNQDYYGFGSIEDRAENTFCGDLSSMLIGMNERYQTEDHPCKLIYINPPYTGVSGSYQSMKPDVYLEQKEYAKAINEIAVSAGFDVIDLYNNNIMNSGDLDIYEEFYNEDGLHFKKEGYTFMAYYIASEIILRAE